MLIGEKVKQLRTERHLSQAAVTDLISDIYGKDFGANTLRRIEKGQSKPRAATLEKIADALGVSIADFLPSDEEVVADIEKRLGVDIGDLSSLSTYIERYKTTDSPHQKLSMLSEIDKYLSYLDTIDFSSAGDNTIENKIAFVDTFQPLPAVPSESEEIMLRLFARLNGLGQDEVIDYATALSRIPKYRVDGDE